MQLKRWFFILVAVTVISLPFLSGSAAATEVRQPPEKSLLDYRDSSVKYFPRYKCSLRLPDKKTWQWHDPNAVPEAAAFAKSEDGIKMLLIVLNWPKEVVLDDAFIAGYEGKFMKRTSVRKISGRKLDFQGVAAYEYHVLDKQLQTRTFGRVFIKGKTMYSLQLLVPQDLKINKTILEKLYGAFSWIDPKFTSSDQPDSVKAYVFQEDTTPDDTVYSVPDAKRYQFAKNGLTFQIDVSGHKLVTINDVQNKRYVFFNIGVDEKSKNLPSQDYISSLASEVMIFAREGELETFVKECKDKYSNQGDTRLVKEVRGGDTPQDAQTVTLLFVSNFIKNKPCSYRAVQFTKTGNSILEINAECAQGMRTTKEHKMLINNVMQSALKSIAVNGKPVDTSVLAHHIKKR